MLGRMRAYLPFLGLVCASWLAACAADDGVDHLIDEGVVAVVGAGQIQQADGVGYGVEGIGVTAVFNCTGEAACDFQLGADDGEIVTQGAAEDIQSDGDQG